MKYLLLLGLTVNFLSAMEEKCTLSAEELYVQQHRVTEEDKKKIQGIYPAQAVLIKKVPSLGSGEMSAFWVDYKLEDGKRYRDLVHHYENKKTLVTFLSKVYEKCEIKNIS